MGESLGGRAEQLKSEFLLRGRWCPAEPSENGAKVDIIFASSIELTRVSGAQLSLPQRQERHQDVASSGHDSRRGRDQIGDSSRDQGLGRHLRPATQ